MKKLLSLLAVSALLVCSFAGCEDADSDFDSNSAAKAASTETTEEEDTTEAKTTEKTTKKTTTKAVTTEENTTEAATKPEGTIGGDIIGKWTVDSDSIGDIIGEALDSGMEVSDLTIEFASGNKMEMYMKMDMSSMMCIKDEAPLDLGAQGPSNPLKDKSFYIQGINCPIGDFDGKSFTTGAMGTLIQFTRSSKSDDIYGSYDIPAEFGMDNNDNFDTASVAFEKSGVAYMEFTQSDTYSYDKKTGKLSSNDSELTSSGSIVTFIDDDTMVITDRDGDSGTLHRVK